MYIFGSQYNMYQQMYVSCMLRSINYILVVNGDPTK